tara:strand:- start:58 stop:456 length:399 start_codon:yes stop_codon:yes gene_type:complete
MNKKIPLENKGIVGTLAAQQAAQSVLPQQNEVIPSHISSISSPSMQNVVNRSRGTQAGMVNEQIGNQALLSKSPFYAAGKGCAKSEGGDGCIKPQGDGKWKILNNKKGGVWRGDIASREKAVKILGGYHANA